MSSSDQNSKYYKKETPQTSYARIPPNSIEAEEAVLGGILIDNDSLNIAAEKLTSEDFYKGANRLLYAAMLKLWDKREPIDIVTLGTELRKLGSLEQAGGIEYLSRLSSNTPSAGNLLYYVKIVKAMSIRRRLIHEASEIVTEAFNVEHELEHFLDSAEQRILRASDFRTTPSFFKVSDVVQDSITRIEKLLDSTDHFTGVASGFDKLDYLTAGFQPSDLIIIAARPAMGKTSLALSIGQFVGVHNGKSVAVFSLEMSKEQIVMRLLCSEARVENSRVRSGHLGESDFPKLVEAASRIANSSIFIDDTPAVTVTELRAKCRRLHREHPLSLILVDYLQLMRSPEYQKSREQEISDISRSLKALAKELNVPVIALSQLNRSVESRNDKRPVMSDLRESGAIEQDADVIMFVYRDEVYNAATPDKGIAELIISKQRSGPTGAVRLAFAGEFTRFDNLEERDDVLANIHVPSTQFVNPGTFPQGVAANSDLPPDWEDEPF
jgi:replicative DNA helicase